MPKVSRLGIATPSTPRSTYHSSARLWLAADDTLTKVGLLQDLDGPLTYPGLKITKCYDTVHDVGVRPSKTSSDLSQPVLDGEEAVSLQSSCLCCCSIIASLSLQKVVQGTHALRQGSDDFVSGVHPARVNPCACVGGVGRMLSLKTGVYTENFNAWDSNTVVPVPLV